MDKILEVEWKGSGLEFKGFSPNEITLDIDGHAKSGSSPMVLLLHSLAACAAIDIVVILERMRLTIASLKVEVDAHREDGDGARVWDKIHLRFLLEGDIQEKKAQRAVDLSVEKYCSAYKQIHCSSEITTELVQTVG